MSVFFCLKEEWGGPPRKGGVDFRPFFKNRNKDPIPSSSTSSRFPKTPVPSLPFPDRIGSDRHMYAMTKFPRTR